MERRRRTRRDKSLNAMTRGTVAVGFRGTALRRTPHDRAGFVGAYAVAVSGGADESVEPRLFGVLVTHRRPEELEQHLACLCRQTRSLDHIVVVDNAPAPANERSVEAYRTHAPAEYVASAQNLGPAGGIARGLRETLKRAADRDWVVLLDDDNPPSTEDTLERVFDLVCASQDDLRVGAVGLTGSRFDWRRARFLRLRDEELEGVIDVDWIGGNQFPMVRVAAVRDIGVFREELFWGLEELDFGLRMRSHGYRILVSGDLVRWARTLHGRLGMGQPRASVTTTRIPWRQYYILRNMIDILRRNGHPWAALRVAATRGIGKSVVQAVRSPRLALSGGRLTIRAIVDGWRGRLGRSLEPGTPVAE